MTGKLIIAAILLLSGSFILARYSWKKPVNPEFLNQVTGQITPTLTDEQFILDIESNSDPDIDREFNNLEQELNLLN